MTPRLLITTRTAKTTRKPGQLPPGLGGVVGVEDERQRHHHRQQHRHPQQLGERRDVAGLVGDAETGADHLGDVVNGAAEEYADRRMIEMEKGDDQLDRRSSRSCSAR